MSIIFDEPCNILVADDSNTARLFIKKNFEQAGFTNKNFIMVSDGNQVLEKIASEPVNLIITDLNMPNLDGQALIKNLKNPENYCAIPVIVMTSASNEARRQELINDGADLVLEKPVTAENIKNAWETIRPKMLIIKKKIHLLKDIFNDVLNGMASLALNGNAITQIDENAMAGAKQMSISSFNPAGYKFILTMKSIILKKLTAIICDINIETVTAENEIETLSELLNMTAGKFMKTMIPADQTFEITCPIPSEYPLTNDEMSSYAYCLKDKIYAVLSLVEPAAAK